MTLEDRVHALRLRLFRRAEELDNVSEACREAGVSRSAYYQLRARFRRYGSEGLHPKFRKARPGRPPQLEGGWQRALYDLRDDPGETRDVSAQHLEVVERLAAELERWAATPLPASGLSDSDLDALRALGYVEETN